jgi:dipeptidase E
MKLFLSSVAMTSTLIGPFTKLVGKPAAEIRIVLSENAADPYRRGGETISWLQDNYQAMEDAGLNITRIDLKAYHGPEVLKAELEQYDVIWLAGGNTFYLRWLLQNTGADNVIRKLVAQGKVFAGASAGAIVAGPTLKHVELADDPKLSPAWPTDGLGLTQTVVVPHFDQPGYATITGKINLELKADGFTTCPLNNDQALIIDGDTEAVLP